MRKRIGGLVGIVGIIALIVSIIQLIQNIDATSNQNLAQATQIDILQKQLFLQHEIATIQMSALGAGPTATDIANRIRNLEATSSVLSTHEASLPTYTPAPSLVEELSVPSNTNLGVTYNVPLSGNYLFQYSNSAFSAFASTDNEPLKWSTLVYGFKGEQVRYGSDGGLSIDAILCEIGSDELYSSEDAAVTATRKLSNKVTKRTFKLNAGEKVTFVVGDGRFDYIDNYGDVILDIYYLP